MRALCVRENAVTRDSLNRYEEIGSGTHRFIEIIHSLLGIRDRATVGRPGEPVGPIPG